MTRDQLQVRHGQLQESDPLLVSEVTVRVSADPESDLEHDFEELVKVHFIGSCRLGLCRNLRLWESLNGGHVQHED